MSTRKKVGIKKTWIGQQFKEASLLVAADWRNYSSHLFSRGALMSSLTIIRFNALTDLNISSKDVILHLLKQVHGNTWKQFDEWKKSGICSDLIAGAWSRELFVGGWHHTV